MEIIKHTLAALALTTSLVPTQSIDLTNWKLTLPTKEATEITQPQLAEYESSYFTKTEKGIVFVAPVSGGSTKNSKYPRSELREMDGLEKAAWTNTKGIHTMTIVQSIDHTPVVKPHVVAGQIHDADDDVVMIRLEGTHLFVEAQGEELETLDANYKLGSVFTTKMVASGGRIKIFHNGKQMLNYKRKVEGGYFKSGSYCQSNMEKGDKPGAYCQVTVYDLKVSHD